MLSSGNDIISDFKIGKDDIGLVYELNLRFKQKGDDLLVKGDEGVKTLLQNVDEDKFLAEYRNDNFELAPAVKVILI